MDRVASTGSRPSSGRRVLRWAFRAVVACALSFVLLEGALRSFHDELLPAAIGNEIASGYHTGWDGIYEFVPEMNGDYPKPRYVRRMAYNGHRWLHSSDSHGFRNAQERTHADVLLLGDSMVYGHGLEQPDTIAQQLENMLGRPVANLGVQGASIHQEYQILKRWVPVLQPRWVFVFFLFNDVEDLTTYLTHEEMMLFVTAPADQRDVAYFDPSRVDPGGLDAILRGSYAARALSVLRRLVAPQLAVPRAHAARLPPKFVRNRGMALALVFHQVALRRMKLIAQDHGARFVNVLVHTGQPGPEAFLEEVLARFCADNGIAVVSLRAPFEAARSRGVQPFLERDGHYSPAGAALAARTVADWIEAHEAAADGTATGQVDREDALAHSVRPGALTPAAGPRAAPPAAQHRIPRAAYVE